MLFIMKPHNNTPGKGKKLTAAMLIAFLLILLAGNAQAQQYMPTDNGSKVQFRIVNHLVFSSTVNGYFKGLKGTIVFNPNDLKASSMDVSVDVNSISTGIGKRDKDLKKEEYFNADKFSVIRIKSSSITAGSRAGNYVLAASLTIKGTTKNISIPFTATPSGNGYLFKGSFSMNRLDYKVGGDNAIDKNLTVMLEVFAKKQ